MKIAVIGAGMIGAAAARHLAMLHKDVTLIGPSEPTEPSTHAGVFASHYDEGRITRRLDPNPVWEELAEASIARYRDIERQSGIDFYQEVGLLIGAPKGSDYLNNLMSVRDASNIPTQDYHAEDLTRAFPHLSFAPDTVMLHQKTQAGHISPRNLVRAQIELAQKQGATLIPEVVLGLDGQKITTETSDHHFDRILLAAGAYTNTLLTDPLDLKPLARTITFLELPPEEALRLSDMPSVIFRTLDGADPYVLPPIRYPDGKTYLKIGGEPNSRTLHSKEDLTHWFASSGDPDMKSYMSQRMTRLIPNLNYTKAHTQACVVTYTSTGLPYIAPLSEHLFVAAGGCGAAAKSSDEIGRIAAQTVLGHTDPRFSTHQKKEN